MKSYVSQKSEGQSNAKTPSKPQDQEAQVQQEQTEREAAKLNVGKNNVEAASSSIKTRQGMEIEVNGRSSVFSAATT